MCIYIHIYAHIGVCVYMDINACVYIDICLCIYIHVHKCIYVHTYIQIHMCTHICVCACRFVHASSCMQVERALEQIYQFILYWCNLAQRVQIVLYPVSLFESSEYRLYWNRNKTSSPDWNRWRRDDNGIRGEDI